MFELSEIEELFKSEDLIKSRAQLHALLNHAQVYHSKTSTPEQKAEALENIKSITAGKTVKKPKRNKLEFHEEFVQHHGGDPIKFKQTFDAMSPKQQKETMNWHKEQVAAKMKKSIEHLFHLFAELKKHL